MLSSRDTSGKYCSRKWSDDRSRAMADDSSFTDAEKTFLDISGSDGGGMYDDRTYKTKSNPVDPETAACDECIDISKRNKAGGAGYGK